MSLRKKWISDENLPISIKTHDFFLNSRIKIQMFKFSRIKSDVLKVFKIVQICESLEI